MIVVIHSLYFVFKFVLHWYRKQKAIAESRSQAEHRPRVKLDEEQHFDAEERLTFATPVYRQRYAAVQDVLLQWCKDIHCIVDFGCAEFAFFQYMKHVIGVNRVLMVDIDETLLKEHKFRVQPLTADYLYQRLDPLVVEILSGSIAEPDFRLKTCDAVVGIEIIEHLYPDTLAALPYNIFGYAQPKVAVFTTPNADFNVLFPHFKGFRHDDHKFEWTREQFEDWALNITSRFPNYKVSFQGVGDGPKGTESLGCCSQMAVFVRESEAVEHNAEPVEDASFGVCTYCSYSLAQQQLLADDLLGLLELSAGGDSTQCNQYYKTIDIVQYPYVVDTRSSDEKMLHAATSQILQHASTTSMYYNEENGYVEIPLYEVVKNFNGYFATETEIKRILLAANYKISECNVAGTAERCECIQYSCEMDETTTSRSNSDYDHSENNDDVEEEQPSSTLPANFNSSSSEWEDQQRNWGKALKEDATTPSDPLVDSGYQKSLSNAEWSPQSPLDNNFDIDGHLVHKLDVNDMKESIKESSTIYAGVASGSRVKSPVAEKPVKLATANCDDDSAVANVKSITTVILNNSLNKVADDDAVPFVERPQVLELEIPRFVVENGDLANNNRDDEGNNYPDNVEHAEEDPNENLLPVLEENEPQIVVVEEVEQVLPLDEDVSGEKVHLMEVVKHDVPGTGISDVAATSASQEETDESASALRMNESPFPQWRLQPLSIVYDDVEEENSIGQGDMQVGLEIISMSSSNYDDLHTEDTPREIAGTSSIVNIVTESQVNPSTFQIVGHAIPASILLNAIPSNSSTESGNDEYFDANDDSIA